MWEWAWGWVWMHESRERALSCRCRLLRFGRRVKIACSASAENILELCQMCPQCVFSVRSTTTTIVIVVKTATMTTITKPLFQDLQHYIFVLFLSVVAVFRTLLAFYTRFFSSFDHQSCYGPLISINNQHIALKIILRIL